MPGVRKCFHVSWDVVSQLLNAFRKSGETVTSYRQVHFANHHCCSPGCSRPGQAQPQRALWPQEKSSGSNSTRRLVIPANSLPDDSRCSKTHYNNYRALAETGPTCGSEDEDWYVLTANVYSSVSDGLWGTRDRAG